MRRSEKVVRYSQPMFLVMIAFGCVVSSCAIILLTKQDADGEDAEDAKVAADFACMSLPWFYSMGFVLSFAPLYCKMWKVVEVFVKAVAELKVTRIKASQLVGMIFVLVVVDGSILAAWTATNPLAYTRTALSVDGKGRVLESYGSCLPQDSSGPLWIFVALIASFHFCLLVGACFIAYKARNVSSAFSESKWIAICLVSNLQIFVIGLPVLAIVADDPEANFFIRAMIIFLNDLSVLLLIFLPKLLSQELGWFNAANSTSRNYTVKSKTGATSAISET